MKGKIFNTQEVQAIIAGTKTMFREVIKPYPVLSDDKSYWEFKSVQWAGENSSYAKNFGDNARPEMPDLCPYQVGQKIFVKESYKNIYLRGHRGAWFRASASEKAVKSAKWLPPMAMPEKLSRLTLEITSIKVERLQDINYEDAIKEGVWNIQEKGSPRSWDVINAFRKSWNATHKKPEKKFEANPFVWVVDFKINK